MSSCWLLPDTRQSGEIRAFRDGAYVTLEEGLDISLRDLPACFALGVPESILEANTNPEFVYAQYARLASGVDLFACSTRAGNDVAGRTVVLTYLQRVNRGGVVSVLAESLPDTTPALYAAMSRLVECLSPAALSRRVNVQTMLHAARHDRYSTYASESGDRVLNRPEWTPKKKAARQKVVGLSLLGFAALTFFLLSG